MNKIAASDSKALEALYNRYSAIMYTLIKKIVQKENVAEEILTDTFAIVWRKIEYFNFSGGNVYSWLITLVRNKAVDFLRRNRSVSPVNEPYNDDYEDKYIIPQLSTDSEALSLEKALKARVKIENALNKLTDAQKYVINMAYYEGYTQSGISEKLNIPIQTVKSKLQIALSNLNDNLIKEKE
jgi:RNA polymerase sigma-70 factor (ECF subfamily)